MQLSVGERLDGSGPEQQPGGYVVTGVVGETPWYGLYAAKKVFYNFDFTAKRVRETDEKEWLDVFLRTIRYPVLDQADYVAQRRVLARAEVHAILGNRHSNLWPEPIDLVELEDARDPFNFAADGADGREREPIVVFARPHGHFLPAWQEQFLSLTSVLSVLAELLDFIAQAHDEGLLLLGLSPDAVVVDTLERVHYVGSDMALSQSSPLLTEANGADAWGRFFPPERFPRGFAAPECVQRGGRPDRRSDLYSWGCLAYLLLTGENPVRIAEADGRPWALFHEEHFTKLAKVLADMPTDVRGPWAEQLGLSTAGLPADWTSNVLGVLRLSLSPNVNHRPRSVAELRQWLVHLPPPAVAGMIALQILPGETKLLIDCAALEAGLHLRVRRCRGTAAVDPEAGVPIYDGPPRSIVVDSELPITIEPEPFYYTVWTVKETDGQAVWSGGVSELLWQPEPANLRRWAEQQVVAGNDPNDYPPRVATVLGVLDPVDAAQGLAQSASPRVRGWGLRRLEQVLRGSFRFSYAEPVLQVYLRDPLGEIRQAAAVTLWNHAEQRDDELLLRLLESLEAPPLDSAPPLLGFLRQIGLPDDRVAQLIATLEHRRPTACPLCQQPITMGERARHLRETHGYVDYDGDALPYAVAVGRLWDRVLQRHERAAHERLLELYLRVTPAGAIEPPGLGRYVTDLGKQVLGQDAALPFAGLDAYLTMLRQCGPFLPIVRLVLAQTNTRLRELGRETLLPVLAERLRSGAANAVRVWQALEDACPDIHTIEERLQLCQRLPAFGVDAAAVSACAARLQEERIVPCSECAAQVRSKDIETHLRRAHAVYKFRGVRRSFEATRDALLRVVCATPPDLKAWQTVRELVGDQHPGDTEKQLVAWVYQHMKMVDAEHRPIAIVGLAEALAGGGGAEAIVPILVGPSRNASYEQLGRRIALELAARMPAPVATRVIDQVQPLLADKDLPGKGRQRAVLALLRTTGRAGPATLDLLRAYVGGSGKLRGLEKLHQLEQRFGQAPAIDELCRELEDQVRMSCPRCPTQLRKKDMVAHLWDRHHLVLDGERVREPWRVLEDWAVDYGLEKDAELLRRCRDLARQVDPEDGIARLYRLMLRRDIQDDAIQSALIALARARQTGLCPYCYGFVPTAESNPPQPLTLEDDTLEGFGYRIVVSERGLVPMLRIEAPDEVFYNNRESGRWLTRWGAMVFIAVPVTALLFVLIHGFSGGHILTFLVFLFAISAGLILAGMLWAFWPSPPPAERRLLRAAWGRLVPHLLDENLARPEWGFLHGLAQLTAEPGRRRPRTDLIAECCTAVAASGKADPVAAACLTELSTLYLDDIRAAHQDAPLFIADQCADCFRGKTSLLLLRALLAHVHATRGEWTRGQLRRLQILIAARAFEQGLACDDVLDMGRVASVVRDVLGLEDRSRWAQLELLWSMSQRRAWEKTGVATSVFELAESGPEAEELLTEHPNLLLSVRKQNLQVTSRGVSILGQQFTARPNLDEISWNWSAEARAYVIEIGAQRVRTPSKPRDLVIELKAWLRFYFDDFLPRLPTARRPITEAAQKMWQALRTPCPECSRPLVPCPGDVGIALR